MKKLLVPLVALFPMVATAQNIGINTDGSAPHSAALLDVNAAALPATDKRGLLIPRMTAVGMNGISARATSLLVFNTSTNGFWYYDGSVWVPLGGGGSGWQLTGNAGTVAGINFLGTTDDVPLVLRTNGVERIRVHNAGNVASAPVHLPRDCTWRGRYG